MRREISQQQVSMKKAAAPAAQAFLEAQAKAEAAELADDALHEREEAEAPPAQRAREANYAWDQPAELDMAKDVGASGLAMPPSPAPMPPGAPMPTGAPMPPPGYLPPPAPPPALGGAGPQAFAERARSAAPVQEKLRREASSAPRKAKMSLPTYEKTSEELQLESTGAKVVETGFFIWRNVIVPPNVYVVHTRRGRAEPVTIGMGKSFRYNPLSDSYLVVPAAMQTIGIFARCISAEKQGINVLAYVQWLISDFSLAYKRLDFSNIHDPMGIVNAQLKEQAEAAIKDTVATMTVEQVLKDKAPIIQELTERMKSVAEGRDGDGLGLKIVTVQIKEAMVASTTLWDNLQAPFRHEKSRLARISEIETEAEIHKRNREASLEREAADAKAASEIAKLRAQVELENREATLASQTRQQELAQKAEQEEQRYRQETELQRIAIEQRREAEQQKTELQRLQADHARAAEEARLAAEEEVARLRAELARQAEEARIAAENQTLAIAQQEGLALARAASQLAELEAQERLVAARREAEAVDLRARMALDKERLAAKLEADRVAEEQRLALQGQAISQDLARLREAAEIDRHRQETANAKTPAALQSEMVLALPQVAQHMPDIQEYRYVGVSDGHGNGGGSAFSALPEFMAKAMGVATAFGWKPQANGGAGAPSPDAPAE